MKYIRGNTTTFRSEPIDEDDHGTAISLIHNQGFTGTRTPPHCLILEGRKGSAVVMLENSKDRELLLDVLQNPPGYHDEPADIGPHDAAYLVIHGCPPWVCEAIHGGGGSIHR